MFTSYTPVQKSVQTQTHRFRTKDNGYLVQQSTKPQTLGHSLADSPIGLLAWIYEKLYIWTDKYPWTEDEILTWVLVYWFSRAGPAASTRIYYEVIQADGGILTERENTRVPLGLSYFPQELFASPQR
jgi:hypothetical protein